MTLFGISIFRSTPGALLKSLLHATKTRNPKNGIRPVPSTFMSSSQPQSGLVPCKEIEGSDLHAAIARISENRYKYDQNLTEAISTRKESRYILGHFNCKYCTPARQWHSGTICTELLFGSSDRYRTILHAQQCRGCEAYTSPKVDEDNYAKKVVSALDLWTGRRKRQAQIWDRKWTPPHDKTRCHGCQKGVCVRDSKS